MPVELLVAWVDRELESFTPWAGDGSTRPHTLQRFAELAIACEVLARSPLRVPVVDERWRPFLLRHVNDPAFGELARSRLEWAWALLLPYLILRGGGERNAYHDLTLRESRRAGFPRALEVVPYRALDYAYFARQAGLAEPGDRTVESLLAETFAARATCRYVVNDDSAYALTHAVFYATSFGLRPPMTGDVGTAAPIVDSMIIDCCVRRHYDLLGELLVASQVLAGCSVDVRNLALPVFFSTLDERGCLTPNAEATERTFDACYHTTLVGLILCATLARARS